MKGNIYLFQNRKIISVVLQNLLDNAVKNTVKGEIHINSEIDKNTVSITISDTGRGMSQEQIDHYLNLFDSTLNHMNELKISGLGLHIVIQLIKKMNGQIEIIKNNPQGTIFIIKFNTQVGI